MPTRADLVVEGTVYFIGLGAKDGGEVVRHDQGSRWVVPWEGLNVKR